MNEEAYKQRSKQFALDVIKLGETLPHDFVTQHIAKQLLRSATSVGANYRAACRAKSSADMIAKLAIVEEEADESMFWLEILIESDRAREEAHRLHKVANELVAMTVASIRTLKSKGKE